MNFFFLFLLLVTGCSTKKETILTQPPSKPFQAIQIGDVESQEKVHQLNRELFNLINSNDCQGGASGSENTCKSQFIMCNTFGGMIPYDICWMRFDEYGSVISPEFKDWSLNLRPTLELPINKVKKSSGEFHFKFNGPVAERLFGFLRGNENLKVGNHLLCKNDQNDFECEFKLNAKGIPIRL